MDDNKVYKNYNLKIFMINRNEIASILIISIIFAFSISLLSSVSYFAILFLSILIMILINVFAKKLSAYFFESEIELKIWGFKRFGYQPGHHLKKEFSAGAFFPIISRLILPFLNGFIWMGSLVFDIKAKSYRAVKRHGFYSFSEMSEEHLAYIVAFGIFANILIALIAYFIGFTEFAKLSIWFSFFNIIPLSNLDGNKLFFGNKILWSFVSAVVLIALGYTFLVN